MPQRNRLLHLCFQKWIRLKEDCTISRRRCLFKTLKHCKTLVELEKGVDGLFGSFARLDSRISSVGLTAAKIDHLQLCCWGCFNCTKIAGTTCIKGCMIIGRSSLLIPGLFSLEKTARVQIDLVPCGQARVEMEVEY
ncbi:uncharacterized protein LOC115993066 isoform X1 [Quercus lobata]|uniref:uncharacterized protein LOC115993066 isoform X1 n=1 Tax=Quercus lobata TaxID=97700 RepID=UPI001246FF37|nr:uncharacterized protein LOC115993066 isoform X1 [Quercus lobata]